MSHEQLEFTLIDPQAFHNKRFSVDAFLVSLTKDVIGPVGKAAGPFSAAKDALSANEHVQRVQRLLDVLERYAGHVRCTRAVSLHSGAQSDRSLKQVVGR